jgi:hypothetical protein
VFALDEELLDEELLGDEVAALLELVATLLAADEVLELVAVELETELGTEEEPTFPFDEEELPVDWQAASLPQSQTISSIAIGNADVGVGSRLAIMNNCDMDCSALMLVPNRRCAPNHRR